MRVKNNGAVPTLLATLRKFPDNTEVVLSALKTLGNLVDLGKTISHSSFLTCVVTLSSGCTKMMVCAMCVCVCVCVCVCACVCVRVFVNHGNSYA